MKNDRRTYKDQYSPSGGLARMIFNGLQLAQGDTGSGRIAQLACHYEQRRCLPADRRGLPTQSRSHPGRNEGSAIVNQILRPQKSGLRLTDSLCGDPPLGKPPTGFSESDVGKPPDAECDVGRFTDEATRFTNAEVRHGCELSLKQVLSERNRPPNWDSGTYSQKAGNRYREACRPVQSPQVRDVSLSWMTGQIHNADVEAFGNNKMKQKDLDRFQLEVRQSRSDKLLSARSSTDPLWQHLIECDSTAVDDFAGPPSSWRYKYFDQCWQNYLLPIRLPDGFLADMSACCLAEWESNLVESVRLILQRWSRVNSFSLTICCTCEKSEHETVHSLHTGYNKST